MSARTHSGSAGLFGFFLGFVAAALIAVGIMMWPHVSREPPLRMVELSVPTPEIPAPPGTIPEAESYPPAP